MEGVQPEACHQGQRPAVAGGTASVTLVLEHSAALPPTPASAVDCAASPWPLAQAAPIFGPWVVVAR